MKTWNKALGHALTYAVWRSTSKNFYAWDLLAKTILLNGLGWTGDNEAPKANLQPARKSYDDASTVLNLDNLLSNSDKLSETGKAYLCLANLYWNQGEKVHTNLRDFTTDAVSRALASIRIQGRTAYITRGFGSYSHAAPSHVQALWLMALTRLAPENTAMVVEKLTNYVAQGNGRSSGYMWAFAPFSMAVGGLSIGMYDQARDNTDPDFRFKVSSGDMSMMDARVTGRNVLPVEVVHAIDNLPALPAVEGEGMTAAPLLFSAQGKGEASVAVSMDFVPAQVSADPIYRGIFVERVLTLKSEDSEEGEEPVQVVKSGTLVRVTIQITISDDLSDVVVTDLVPGGLEPLDPLIHGKAATRSMPQFRPFSWYSAFGPQDTYPDRVEWNAPFLSAGTHTLDYVALAVTHGTFLHPPTKAHVEAQPELMGLSGGGYFVVHSETLTKTAIKSFLQENSIPSTLDTPEERVSCDDECGESDTCDFATGKCVEQRKRKFLFLPPRGPDAKATGFDWGEGCKGGDGKFSASLPKADDTVVIGEIPAGKWGVRIDLQAKTDLDIQILDLDDDLNPIVLWSKYGADYAGILGLAAGRGEATYQREGIKDMKIVYSGYNGVQDEDGNQRLGHEYIEIIGEVTTRLLMRAYAYQSGEALVTYSWEDSKSDCCLGKGVCIGNPFERFILKDKVVVVGDLPVGIKDVRIELTSNVDTDVQLYDQSRQTDQYPEGVAIIGWCPQKDCNFGELAGMGVGEITIDNVEYVYSGYNGADGVNRGNEYIEMNGITNRPLQMATFGYEAGVATITYSYYMQPPADN